jgi:hypothetical protein
MNSRRGSDVLEDIESNGVASLTFARMEVESPSRIERERRRGAAPTIEKEGRNPRFWSGVFIPQRRLSVVPTQARYYRGYEEIEIESPWFYRPVPVVPTRRRFNREKPKFQQ